MGNAAAFLATAAGGYLGSFINLAYLINTGDAYDSLTSTDRDTLVHETTHVWQGKNNTFALSDVFNSIYNQCVLANAYAYTAGQAWSSYNAEHRLPSWKTGIWAENRRPASSITTSPAM
jgi:hypothetical protein